MNESEAESPLFFALLERAKAGDVAALAELDAAGLLIAPGEELPGYLERLTGLRRRLGGMEQVLREEGEFTCDSLRLPAAQRIAPELLRECTDTTRKHYGFQIDWVPAFFINPAIPWLFGGCAYYFHPEMFALLIIGRRFSRRRKWFIYDRNEILAHEMCHTARLALGSVVFEERFAYRISESGFRRRFGGVFESPRDSLLLLGSTFLLLGAQIVQMSLAPGLPIWPFWSLIGGVTAFLLGRDRQRHRTLRRAEDNLVRLLTSGDEARAVGRLRTSNAVARTAKAEAGEGTGEAWEDSGGGQGGGVAPDGRAGAILFRCTDQEIAQIAGLSQPVDLQCWLAGRVERELRWQVTARRFNA